LKNSLCIAILVILTERKHELNVFLMKFQSDHISKTLFICSVHFTADLFLKHDTSFSERLKIKDDAVQTSLDPTVD